MSFSLERDKFNSYYQSYIRDPAIIRLRTLKKVINEDPSTKTLRKAMEFTDDLAKRLNELQTRILNQNDDTSENSSPLPLPDQIELLTQSDRDIELENWFFSASENELAEIASQPSMLVQETSHDFMDFEIAKTSNIKFFENQNFQESFNINYDALT